MGKKKLVLDTNNLISALGWKGNPKTIFNQIIEEKFELLLSGKQMNELLRVADYPKFKFTQEQKDRFISIILEISTLIETKENLNIIKEDPQDNMILECALEGKADYIISGDRHLLGLKEFRGIKIVTAKQFLEIISENSWTIFSASAVLFFPCFACDAC